MRKIAFAFNRGFFCLYICLFLVVGIAGTVTVAFFGELGNEYPIPVIKSILRILIILIFFAVIFLFYIFSAHIFLSTGKSIISKLKLDTPTIIICMLAILIVQLIFAFSLQMIPKTDVEKLNTYATQIVLDNSFDCLDSDFNNHYIIRYPNNLAMLLLMTCVYKATYFFTGAFSHIPIIILNTLAINASILLTVLVSRNMFGDRKAITTLILCALFTPYYTYTPYFYTDSFSILFVISAIYFLSTSFTTKSGKKRIICFIISGMICFFGFKLKGSVLILVPATLLYMPIKYNIKKSAKTILLFLMSFCLLWGSTSILNKTIPLISEESSNKYQFPVTHWIMMGLSGVGGFNDEDSDYTKSFPTKSEKTDANLREIGNRLNNYGFFGVIRHLGYKVVWTYMDGTYYIANYLENYKHKTPLHDLILYDGKLRFLFYAYSFAFQMFIFLMMGFSAIKTPNNNHTTPLTMLRIAVTGLFIFFMIWETNSRYPFNFTPLYMLLATEGIYKFVEIIKKTHN